MGVGVRDRPGQRQGARRGHAYQGQARPAWEHGQASAGQRQQRRVEGLRTELGAHLGADQIEAGWRAVITAMETITSAHGWTKQPQPVIAHFKNELAAYLAEMRGPGPSPMTFTRLPRPT